MGVIGRKAAVLAFRLRRGTTAGRSPIARRAERRRDTEALIHDVWTREGTKNEKNGAVGSQQAIGVIGHLSLSWRIATFLLDTKSRNGKFVRSGIGN